MTPTSHDMHLQIKRLLRASKIVEMTVRAFETRDAEMLELVADEYEESGQLNRAESLRNVAFRWFKEKSIRLCPWLPYGAVFDSETGYSVPGREVR